MKRLILIIFIAFAAIISNAQYHYIVDTTEVMVYEIPANVLIFDIDQQRWYLTSNIISIDMKFSQGILRGYADYDNPITASITQTDISNWDDGATTHTGEVTGDAALSLDKTAVSNKTIVTAIGADYVLIEDASDGELKKSLISDFASAGGDMSSSTYDPTTIAGDVFSMDNMVEGSNNKILTVSERNIIDNQSGINTGDNSDNTIYANDYRVTNFVSGTDYEPAKGIDDNYVTDAEKTVIGNTSGTNTGDNSANTLYANDYRVANFVSGTDYEPAKGTDDNYVTDAEKTVISNTSGTNTGDQVSSDFDHNQLTNYTTNEHFLQSEISIPASQISDFDTEVSNNTNVSNNTAKNTNATHTGEVTGDAALSLDKTSISNKTIVTAIGADYVLIEDASDGELKKSLISDFASAGGDMTASTYDPTTIAGDAFAMDNMVEGSNNKILTVSERNIIGNTSGTNTGDNPYTLPTSTNSILGGIKVGPRLSIDAGVLSADVQSGGGGGSAGTRKRVSTLKGKFGTIEQKTDTLRDSLRDFYAGWDVLYDINYQIDTISWKKCNLYFEVDSYIVSDSINIEGTTIIAGMQKIFDPNMNIWGEIDRISEAYVEWFGAVGDSIVESSALIEHTLDEFTPVKVLAYGDVYILEQTINMHAQVDFEAKKETKFINRWGMNESLLFCDYEHFSIVGGHWTTLSYPYMLEPPGAGGDYTDGYNAWMIDFYLMRDYSPDNSEDFKRNSILRDMNIEPAGTGRRVLNARDYVGKGLRIRSDTSQHPTGTNLPMYRRFYIVNYEIGDDFTNLGTDAVNTTGNAFTVDLDGGVPNDWTHGSILRNTGNSSYGIDIHNVRIAETQKAAFIDGDPYSGMINSCKWSNVEIYNNYEGIETTERAAGHIFSNLLVQPKNGGFDTDTTLCTSSIDSLFLSPAVGDYTDNMEVGGALVVHRVSPARSFKMVPLKMGYDLVTHPDQTWIIVELMTGSSYECDFETQSFDRISVLLGAYPQLNLQSYYNEVDGMIWDAWYDSTFLLSAHNTISSMGTGSIRQFVASNLPPGFLAIGNTPMFNSLKPVYGDVNFLAKSMGYYRGTSNPDYLWASDTTVPRAMLDIVSPRTDSKIPLSIEQFSSNNGSTDLIDKEEMFSPLVIKATSSNTSTGIVKGFGAFIAWKVGRPAVNREIRGDKIGYLGFRMDGANNDIASGAFQVFNGDNVFPSLTIRNSGKIGTFGISEPTYDFEVGDGSSGHGTFRSDNILDDGNKVTISDDFRLSSPTVPSSSGDTGAAGDIAWDTNYFYVCTATNTWTRIALAW